MPIALGEPLTKFKEYKEDIDQTSVMVWRKVPLKGDVIQLHSLWTGSQNSTAKVIF